MSFYKKKQYSLQITQGTTSMQVLISTLLDQTLTTQETVSSSDIKSYVK